ncbi:MAG: UDP-glucose 4-epimerase GalE [Deinococcales bacterium]
MNILVTGGAGYIGSITSESLIARGHKVVVLDNLSTGHRRAIHPEAHFVQADIAAKDVVRQTLENYHIEAVMHFAASSLVGESMQKPMQYFQNNSAGSLALLEAMLASGVKKFVLSSTAALFGRPKSLPIPSDAPIQPESVYGESKYLIERMLAWLADCAGLGFVCLRYFNAAGASEHFGEDHQPESHLIPLVLQVAQGKRERIHIYGDNYDTPDGSCIRDYIHVQDLASAHILAIEALQPGEKRYYNLGNGQGFSVKEVIEVCRQVTGHAIPSQLSPRRSGDPAALVADASSIQKELGWETKFKDLESIVSSAWRWHLAHPQGYQD